LGEEPLASVDVSGSELGARNLTLAPVMARAGSECLYEVKPIVAHRLQKQYLSITPSTEYISPVFQKFCCLHNRIVKPKSGALVLLRR